jgi:tRNA acetyltransferase TAN1
MVKDDPWSVRRVLRFIPIERECNAEIEEMVEVVKELAQKIGEKDSFKVVVEKRHSQLSSMDIIRAVAEPVERKVNLENPDWLVLIEIIGPKAGISVLRPKDIFRSLESKLQG